MQIINKCSTIAGTTPQHPIEKRLLNMPRFPSVDSLEQKRNETSNDMRKHTRKHIVNVIGCTFANYLQASFIVLLTFTMLSSQLSHAGNVDHVNIGRVVIEDQSMASQQQAGKMALEQVLVKLSGNVDVAQEPEIAKAINNYEQFLVASSFSQQGQSLVFEANFNQAKVQNLLLASGKNVWASLRPSAVLWLVLETNDKQKVIFSQESANTGVQKVAAKAFARGVDIVIPVGDLDDAMNVSVFDVWNQFVSKLQVHSERYATDYLISATIQALNELAPDPNGYTHKLDYVITYVDYTRTGNVKTGYLFGRSEEDLLMQLVDIYANNLAQEFALSSQLETALSTINLVVSGVDSLAAYVNVMALVKSIPAIEGVRFVSQVNDVAMIEIEHKMSREQLKSILLLDRRLSAQISSPSELISLAWQDQ